MAFRPAEGTSIGVGPFCVKTQLDFYLIDLAFER